MSAACSDDESTGPGDEVRVRVVHASPDAPDVDVLVDGTEVLTHVSYLAASDYLELEAGERNVQVNAAGTTTAVIEADVNLTGGETPVLSGVAFGEVGEYIEAPAGEYQVRVTLAGTTTVVMDTGPIELSSGQVRTAIAVDAPGGGVPFDRLLLSDLS